MSVFSEQLDMFIRLCVVYVLMLVLFALNTISLSFPLTGSVEMPLVIMAIYYWSVYRPTIVPLWFVFAAGILLDLLSGLPVGLNAFIFITIRLLILDQRLFLTGQHFLTVWLGFIGVCAAAMSVQWILFGLIHWHWTPFQPMLVMIVLGIFLFPVVSVLLHLTHRLLPMLQNQYSAVK